MKYKIRVIVDEKGEHYLNARDVILAMKGMAVNGCAPSISILNFVRLFVINLITARSE